MSQWVIFNLLPILLEWIFNAVFKLMNSLDNLVLSCTSKFFLCAFFFRFFFFFPLFAFQNVLQFLPWNPAQVCGCFQVQQVNFWSLFSRRPMHLIISDRARARWGLYLDLNWGRGSIFTWVFLPTLTPACLCSRGELKLLTHSQCAGCCSPLQMWPLIGLHP